MRHRPSREPVGGAGGEGIASPGAVLRHDDDDIAAKFAGELVDVLRVGRAVEHADELRIDRFAALRRQRRA